MDGLELKVGYFLQNLLPLKIWGGFWLFVSNFFIIIAILTLIYLYISIDRRVGYMFIVTTAVSMLIGVSIKLFTAESRPFAIDPNIKNLDVKMNEGFSFPSLHCSFVSSVATEFYTYYRYILSFYAIYYIFINILIILARIILGSHYIHDCLFGCALGMFSSFIVLSILYRHYSSFVNRYKHIIGLIMIFGGLTCAILAQVGIKFFVDKIDIFYIISGIGSFVLGDALERRYICCDCGCKFLKRVIRFALFLIIGALIYFVYSFFFKLNIIFTEILILILTFYATIGFSWLGTIMMLYEKDLYTYGNI